MDVVAAARDLWLVLEPYHAMVYFAPERTQAYTEAGLKGGWMGYFASRAAAMGPVPAEVVTAIFYNFHPAMVARAIPDAWRLSTPSRVLRARWLVVDGALRRLLGATVGSDGLLEAAGLLRRACESVDLAGRPLAAAHASLQWPDEPHLAAWLGATILREHRGDGHVAALLVAGIDGCEANVLAAGAAVLPDEQRAYRGWSDDDWEAAVDRLRSRGWLEAGGRLTEAGQAAREAIERDTDRLAAGPYAALGEAECERLFELAQPLARAIVDQDGVPYPNAMGLPVHPSF